MPTPEAYLSATVFVPRYRDLIPLIDTVNYLENSAITWHPGAVFARHDHGTGGRIQLPDAICNRTVLEIVDKY